MKTQTKQGNRIPIEVMRNQVRKYADGGVVTETPEERSMRINSSFDDLSNRLTREMGQENETPEERTRRVNEGFPKLVQRLNGSSLPSDNETPVEKPDWEASVQKVLTDAIVGAEKESEVAQQVVSASMLEAAHLKTEAANRAVVEAQLLADQANEKLAQLKQAKAERFNAAHLKTESANKAVTDAQLLANQANEKFAQLKQAKADKTVNSNKTDVEMYNSNGSDINEFEGDPAAEAVHNKFLAGQAEDERLSAIRQAEDAKMMEGLNAKSEASMQKAAEYAESLRGGSPAQPQREAIPALGQQAAPVQPTMPPNSEMTPPQPMPAAQPQEVVAPALGQQAAAQSAAQPSSGAPARAPTPQPAPMTGMQSIMKNYTDKRNALNAQQQKILDDLQLRIDQPSNSWFALAKGFGAPTQTGSFHEAFGKAIGSYSDNQTKTTEQLQALAKMRMELAQNQMKQSKSDAGMGMIGSLSGNDQNMAVGAGQSVAGAGNPTAQQNSGWLSKVTPEFLAQYSIIDPDGAKALEAAIKVDIESQKMGPQGGVYNARTGKWSTNFQPGQAQVPVYVPGRGTFSWRPEETHYYYAEREKGPEAEKAAFEYITRGPGSTLAKPTGGAASSALPQSTAPAVAPSEVAAPPLSQEDLKVLATRRAAEATKQGTTDAVTRDAIRKSDNTSYSLTNSADAIIKIAQEHPTIIGVLAKPGIGTAILSAIEEGVRVGYHGSVGIPALSDAVRKISGSTQEDIDAAAAITRYGREIELGYRNTFLKGQGAVSNMEGEKIVDIVPNVKDPAKVLLMKAEHIKNIAAFDRANAKALARWDDKHPSGSMAQYEQSKEYLAARRSVSEATDALREKYFPSKKTTKPASGDKLGDLINEFEREKK